MTTTHLLRRELKRFLPWHQARLDCLSHLMVSLIQVRTVNLTQIALAFDVAVQSESVYKRVKRFFRHHVFETDGLAVLVTSWLDLGPRLVLCLDRTKKDLAENLAQNVGLDLGRCFAYGNHQSDLPLLELVGNPYAVEPTNVLRKIAVERQWPILNYR